VLDHEERALAEIETQLRAEAPDLHRLLEADDDELAALLAHPHDTTDPRAERARARRARAAVHALVALVAAVAATAATTVAFGPDAGGLVGAIALTVSSTYGYQVLRGCPGLRRQATHPAR
jgi:hypothetical protein